MFRNDLRALDLPSSVRPEHDADLVAIVAIALVADRDRRLADIRTRDASDLPGLLWEPDELIDAMTTSCGALAAAAVRLGVSGIQTVWARRRR